VVDESGNGLSGAGVTLTNSDGGRFSTSTDEWGYYALDVAAGLYAVNAQHPGYAFIPRSGSGGGRSSFCRQAAGGLAPFRAVHIDCRSSTYLFLINAQK
jgi:hypothetical protein